jgi:hypothetical protein
MTILYAIRCANGHDFEAADPGPGTYGDFVMYGDSLAEGPAYLEALQDPVFAEVRTLLRQLPGVAAKSDTEQADLVQAIFGVACDPAPNGSTYRIGFPPCPSCGTRKFKTWSFARKYDGALLPVTHRAWSSASRDQKLALLRAAQAQVVP